MPLIKINTKKRKTGQNTLRIDSSTTAITFHNHSEFIGYIGNDSGKLFINAGGTEDTLILKTNGSERLRITSNGSIGIGVTNPSSLLHVDGDVTIKDASPAIFFIDDSGTPQNPDYRIQVNTGNFVINDDTNPNGSKNNIAGIINEQGNILGMMPHPERATDKVAGLIDGEKFFISVLESIQ